MNPVPLGPTGHVPPVDTRPARYYGQLEPYREWIERDWGPNPNFAEIWDALPAESRAVKQRILQFIRERIRDRIATAERQHRIEQRAQAAAEQARSEIEREMADVARRANELKQQAEQEAAAARWNLRETRRSINLDD